MAAAKQAGEPHFYLMELEVGVTIDGRHKSNIARLINTSCSPNCCTQKWVDAATGESNVLLSLSSHVTQGVTDGMSCRADAG